MKIYEKYPCQVEIVRKFTSGLLEGLTHTDRMGFMTQKDAKAWASAVSNSTHTNYTVVSLTDIKTGENLNFS
jgi:trehalose-6-phosphate synthase